MHVNRKSKIRRIQPTAIPLTRLHIHTPLTPSLNTLLIQQMDFLPIILFNERFFEIDHGGEQIIERQQPFSSSLTVQS